MLYASVDIYCYFFPWHGNGGTETAQFNLKTIQKIPLPCDSYLLRSIAADCRDWP